MRDFAHIVIYLKFLSLGLKGWNAIPRSHFQTRRNHSHSRCKTDFIKSPFWRFIKINKIITLSRNWIPNRPSVPCHSVKKRSIHYSESAALLIFWLVSRALVSRALVSALCWAEASQIKTFPTDWPPHSTHHLNLPPGNTTVSTWTSPDFLKVRFLFCSRSSQQNI